MDVIEKDVAMLKEKGFTICSDTEYLVQEKGVSGDWYTLRWCLSLDSAITYKGQHLDRWYRKWDTEMAPYPVRIVMRHTVEVVL